MLPSQDEDMFFCESTSDQSLSSSTKGSPTPPILTNSSVNIWMGLALLSSMCQETGGKGVQVGDTRVPSILKPLEVAQTLV